METTYTLKRFDQLEPGGLKDKRVTLAWLPSSPVNIVAAQ